MNRGSGRFPPVFFLFWSLGVLLPIVSIVAFSFIQTDPDSHAWSLTIAPYLEIFSTGRWEVTARTLRICATVTALLLLVSLPFALWLAKGVRSARLQLITWTLLTAPFFLSATARTIIWRPILGLNGPVNLALLHWGIIDSPLPWLLFSEPAVHFGLIGPYLPNMIWPIYLSITLIDDELLESSQDLGATPWQTLRHVILPLSLPGIIAGIVFTFVPMLGDDTVPKLIGGQQIIMLGGTMSDLVLAQNYPVAAAMSALILASVIVLQWLFIKALRHGR